MSGGTTFDVGGFAGDLVGAAASIFGGNQSKHESQANRREARRQFNETMDFTKNQTQYRVQDALKAGINPLAALGMNSVGVSPTISAGGTSGAGEMYADAGRQFGNAFSKIINREARDQVRDAKESRALDLESKRIDNQIKKAELAALRNPGIPGNGVEPGRPEPTPNGEKSLFTVAYDLEGNPRLVIDQDVTENDSDNAAYISALKGAIASGWVHPISGRVTSDQLRMKIAEDYYNRTGRNIENLDSLYLAPSEVAVAGYQLARGI